MFRLHQLRAAILPMSVALLLSGCTLFFDTHPGDPPAENTAQDTTPDAGADAGADAAADSQTGN